MNTNPAIQSTGLVSWDGAASTPRDVTDHVNFGWSMEITADIATDAVFDVFYHDPSAADPCVPDAAQPAMEVAKCSGGAVGATGTITIPAGTTAGSVCAVGWPCRAGKFMSLGANSGDTANVVAVMILKGPNT